MMLALLNVIIVSGWGFAYGKNDHFPRLFKTGVAALIVVSIAAFAFSITARHEIMLTSVLLILAVLLNATLAIWHFFRQTRPGAEVPKG
jgi:hypothetical protein